MRLTLEALDVLDAIDRQGSFAAAATVLHRVPSAVTYAIQKLEEDLGVRLFDRSGHRARLTQAGMELLREGRHLLQAAEELEGRVQRVASGCEVELRIAVDDLIPLARVFPLVESFYQENFGTRLRLLMEVYGGAWDALVSQRADLVIGAPGEGPPGGGYTQRLLGSVAFVFAVAPDHPLAQAPEPIPSAELLRHRAISIADTSRHLAPRTSGLLNGQDVLTVPDMPAKIAAQVLGLGVGYLPRYVAQQEVAAGRLLIKDVEAPKADAQLFLAWQPGRPGKALRWFLKHLENPETVATLFA